MNAVVTPRSPAGFWKRYVAYFIDVVLVYIVVDLLSGLFFPDTDAGGLDISALMKAVQNQQALPEDQTAMLAHATASLTSMLVFSTIAYIVIAGAYFVLCETSAWQATLGKRLIGIKVVDAKGKPISRGRATARFFAAGLSWLSLNVGHAMAAWTPERRALHDYLAETRVENVDPANPQMPLWGWLVIALQALVFLLGIVAIALAVAHALSAATDQF